jgi:Flp pilus assembly protein TadG
MPAARAHAPGPLRRFRRNRRGAAAVEFALVTTFLMLAVVNVTDFALYIYQRMEVQNAAQMASQAAWKSCNTPYLPATTKCSGLNSAIATAVKSTSLGTKVSLVSGYPAESYYCLDANGNLVAVGSLSAKPADCTATGYPSELPGDYIELRVTYTYQPIMGGISLSSLLPNPVVSSSTQRLQ